MITVIDCGDEWEQNRVTVTYTVDHPELKLSVFGTRESLPWSLAREVVVRAGDIEAPAYIRVKEAYADEEGEHINVDLYVPEYATGARLFANFVAAVLDELRPVGADS